MSSGSDDRAAAARAIIDEIFFMTLATVDAQGVPWATPVWFAHAEYSEFLWVSRPDTRHSQNIAATAPIAIVRMTSSSSWSAHLGPTETAQPSEYGTERDSDTLIAHSGWGRAVAGSSPVAPTIRNSQVASANRKRSSASRRELRRDLSAPA